jgi:hypothetical protein
MKNRGHKIGEKNEFIINCTSPRKMSTEELERDQVSLVTLSELDLTQKNLTLVSPQIYMPAHV